MLQCKIGIKIHLVEAKDEFIVIQKDLQINQEYMTWKGEAIED